MLKVGVHRAEDCRVGVPPTMQHGSGKARLPFADEQPHTRVLPGDRRNKASRSVAAVIIDDEDLILQAGKIERLAHTPQKRGQIFYLAERRNDESQPFPQIGM